MGKRTMWFQVPDELTCYYSDLSWWSLEENFIFILFSSFLIFPQAFKEILPSNYISLLLDTFLAFDVLLLSLQLYPDISLVFWFCVFTCFHMSISFLQLQGGSYRFLSLTKISASAKLLTLVQSQHVAESTK